MPTKIRGRISSVIRAAIPLACLTTVATHGLLLQVSELDWQATPIAALSQTEYGYVHTLCLWLFASGQLGLLALLSPATPRSLTHVAKYLVVLVAILVAVLSLIFQSVHALNHTVMLSIVASTVGILMALLLPATQRSGRLLFFINSLCLLLWIALIPVGFFIPDTHTGAYQRTVAMVYVFWLGMLGVFLRTKRIKSQD